MKAQAFRTWPGAPAIYTLAWALIFGIGMMSGQAAAGDDREARQVNQQGDRHAEQDAEAEAQPDEPRRASEPTEREQLDEQQQVERDELDRRHRVDRRHRWDRRHRFDRHRPDRRLDRLDRREDRLDRRRERLERRQDRLERRHRPRHDLRPFHHRPELFHRHRRLHPHHHRHFHRHHHPRLHHHHRFDHWGHPWDRWHGRHPYLWRHEEFRPRPHHWPRHRRPRHRFHDRNENNNPEHHGRMEAVPQFHPAYNPAGVGISARVDDGRLRDAPLDDRLDPPPPVRHLRDVRDLRHPLERDAYLSVHGEVTDVFHPPIRAPEYRGHGSHFAYLRTPNGQLILVEVAPRAFAPPIQISRGDYLHLIGRPTRVGGQPVLDVHRIMDIGTLERERQRRIRQDPPPGLQRDLRRELWKPQP